jgi:hypothetical protein
MNRDDTIRTCDPLVPNQVLYQAELRPVIEWLTDFLKSGHFFYYSGIIEEVKD